MTRPAGAKTVRFRTIRTRNPSRYRSVAHHLALYLCLSLVMLVAQACGGEQTPTPTATPEAVASPSATSTHTPTPEATPTEVRPTSTATLEPAPSPSPTQTDTPTPDPTPTEEPPTSTATLEPTPSPSPTQTDTPTPDPTPTEVRPTSTATLEPTPSPSPTQTDTPTPVATPTDEPPTFTPTLEPTPSPSPDLLGQTYSNPNDGFEIRPPRGWAVDDSGLLGTKVIFSSETPDLHDETPTQANINILTVPAQGITLEELAVASKEQFKIMVTNFTLLGETFRVVDDYEAHVFEYTYSQGVFPLRGMQLIVVDEDKAYAITATALSATWDKYEAAFDASLRSFRTLADSPSVNGTAAPDADSVDGGQSPAPTDTPEAVDSQSPAQPSQPYSNSMDGFEIQPPDGWAVDDSGAGGTSVIFYITTPDLHGDAPFRANMNVSVWPADGTKLEELVPAIREEYKRSGTDFTLLEETSPIVNDLETYVFDYTHSQGGFPLRVMQLAAIYEDKIYAVTATALDGTWENYEAVFEASFRSFRVLADSPAPTGTPEAVDSQSPDLLGPPYSDSINGFEIRPPSGWTVDQSGLLGTKVAFIRATPDLHERTPFSANIVIYVEPAEGMTLEEFVELSKAQYPLVLTDFALLGDETAMVNGREIHFLESTFTHGVFPLRNRQLIAIYEDKAYMVTTTALDAAWQQHEAVFDASLRSFRILDGGDSESP